MLQPVVWTNELVCRGSVSAFAGVVLGIVVSLIVNCTLVEISLSVFFSSYFGLLFLSVGVLILWRVLTIGTSTSSAGGGSGSATATVTAPNPGGHKRRLQLMLFAMLIILSGFLCFILEKNWCVGLSSLTKIPLYTLLGVSVSFALVFSIVDLINYISGLFQAPAAKPLVESQNQVYVVVLAALLMGGIFGFIFGVMDVEDVVSYQVRLALMREEHFCYPIGAVIGGACGFANEYVRTIEDRRLFKMSEFDEDI
eukprot:Filipodium_phascolosomae@DN4694_c0_g1_i1.p1